MGVKGGGGGELHVYTKKRFRSITLIEAHFLLQCTSEGTRDSFCSITLIP